MFLDSDTSQHLEYVRYCSKIITIEEDWITKMRLVRDEWSRTVAGWIMKSTSDCSNYQRMHYPPYKLNSWASGLFVISVSPVRCGSTSTHSPLASLWFYFRHKRVSFNAHQWSSSVFIKVDMKLCNKSNNGIKDRNETRPRLRWNRTPVISPYIHTRLREKMKWPNDWLTRSTAVNELNCWLTQPEQH